MLNIKFKMSTEIPQIPQPVPFQFHGRTDYTTVYKAIDFPLDHFAILKQNPVNRDRVTEANKMLYSLQKQVNDLREALIALAITVDENVEKKVTLSLKIGNETKDIEGKLLKDTYTFTITGVEFGEQESITATVQLDESNYIEVEGELECAEGGDVEVKGKAKEVKEGEEAPVITIKKSTEPSTFTLKGTLLKAGEQEATDITFTISEMTATATVDALKAGDKITLTLSAGYAFDPEPVAPAVDVTDLSFTVKADETVTEKTVKELEVTA